MTETDKIRIVKTMLDGDAPSDETLSDLLLFAGNEIRGWNRLSADDPIPPKYEQTQMSAVVFAVNQEGAEGQRVHNENGINRSFAYSSILQFIRQHVNSGVTLYK